jgi:uncharacterized metal-binding protein
VSEKQTCACGGALKLIFPCSGGSDVGELSDRAARKLTNDGIGKMYCLAGIGGRVSGIMASTESAAKILALDGCPLNCARKTLEQAGFAKVEHLCLADLGLLKGVSEPTAENIGKVARAAMPLLARP